MTIGQEIGKAFAHFTTDASAKPQPSCMTIRRNRTGMPARYSCTTVHADVTCARCLKSRAYLSRVLP